MLLYPATLDDDDYTASWQSTDEETRCNYTQRKVLTVRRSSLVPKIRAGARVLDWNKGGGMGSFQRAHGECLEREPITGLWGKSLQRGPGAEAQSPWSGGQGAKPPEAEIFLALGRATDGANLYPLQYFQQSITIR